MVFWGVQKVTTELSYRARVGWSFGAAAGDG